MAESWEGANHEPVPPLSGTLELVTKAARNGAADAREAATRAWNASNLFACRFIYTTCYTVSYGVVFSSTLIAHAVPRNNAAVRGLIDGAHAAKSKVEQIHTPALDAPTPALAPT